MRAYKTHLHTNRPPPYVYISHNHTDHAGELPVVAAVACAQQAPAMTLLAQRDVLNRLLQHRLHELQSTGLPVNAFLTPVALEQGQQHTLPEGLSIQPVRARHAELCFGLIVRWHGHAVLGWTVCVDCCDGLCMLPSVMVLSALLCERKKTFPHRQTVGWTMPCTRHCWTAVLPCCWWMVDNATHQNMQASHMLTAWVPQLRTEMYVWW